MYKERESTYTDSMVQHQVPPVPSFPFRRMSLFLDDCALMIALAFSSLSSSVYKKDERIARLRSFCNQKGGVVHPTWRVQNLMWIIEKIRNRKWTFFEVVKGRNRETHNAHLLPDVELCSLRSIPESTTQSLRHHRNDASLHRAPLPIFFFSLSRVLKCRSQEKWHFLSMFPKLLGQIRLAFNVHWSLFLYDVSKEGKYGWIIMLTYD